MKTISDYLQIIIDMCMPWDSNIECYTYCDRQPRQCCRMTKLSISMLKRGEYQ